MKNRLTTTEGSIYSQIRVTSPHIQVTSKANTGDLYANTGDLAGNTGELPEKAVGFDVPAGD